MGMLDFVFQQDLAPVHTTKGTKSCFCDHSGTNCPDQNLIENLCKLGFHYSSYDPVIHAKKVQLCIEWCTVQCMKILFSMMRFLHCSGFFLYSIWLSKEVNFGFLLVSHNHQKYMKSITLCVKYQRVSLFEQYYWFILDELIYKDS